MDIEVIFLEKGKYMSGLGAWSFGFYHESMSVPNSRVKHGILSFKEALIHNGFGTGRINTTLPEFGTAAKEATIAFQKHEGITADGVIGPETARHLFRIYSAAAEQGAAIPDHLVQRIGCHESAHDPVAQGYVDLKDEGWAQINLPSHPDVTQIKAWDTGWAISWVAGVLKGFYDNKVSDWDGAVASYNIGEYYAVQWVKDGKPGSGGPIFSGTDIYSRATAYVAGVKAMPV